MKFMLKRCDNIRKGTSFIWNIEQNVTNLFYICIEFKKSKSEARNCGNSIGGHSRDAAWRENIFRERRQVSQHPHSQQ